MSNAATPTPPPTPRKRFSPLTVVLVVLAIASAGGYYLYEKSKFQEPPPVDEFAGLKGFYQKLGQNQVLAPEFTDADKNLVADPPTDPSKILKIDEIGFSMIGTNDEERLKSDQEEWKDLMTALGNATKKPVKYRTDLNGAEAQMAALKEGRLHVTAFNTGAVTAAVNTAGFVPLFAPADEAGNFAIRMEILVKAGSPIQKPEELRGKTIGFVALSSNSGAKAPMFVLKEKFGMLPGRDYKFKLTGDHTASIVGLIEGSDCDAVCVASDLKDRAFAGPLKFRGQEKNLKADQVRTIYTSDPMPPLCFGVPYNLPPEVRAQVEKTFREFRFAGTSADKYARQGKVKFVSVNYVKDWKYVREIDVLLSRLAEQR